MNIIAIMYNTLLLSAKPEFCSYFLIQLTHVQYEILFLVSVQFYDIIAICNAVYYYFVSVPFTSIRKKLLNIQVWIMHKREVNTPAAILY